MARIPIFAIALAALVAAACGDGDSMPCNQVGCDGAPLCDRPDDLAERGPWPVGARTVVVDGLTVEVWYPARFGSERKADPIVYDVRTVLDPDEARKIPDEDNPFQTCDCYRDLPVDDKHGPYPAIVFIHGTAGYRMQSLEHLVHWASRGFVVLAADHPGLYLADMLAVQLESDLEGDVAAVLAALKQPDGPLAFLGDRADTGRMGLAGHSAGGMAVGRMAGIEGVRAVIPMAAEGVTPTATHPQVLVMGAMQDAVVPYQRQQQGYADSDAPKRLVGISGAGHLVFSNMCDLTNAAGQDVVTVAIEHGITNAELATGLFDCGPEGAAIDPVEGRRIVNAYTVGVFEQALHCADRSAALDALAERFERVGEVLSSP